MSVRYGIVGAGMMGQEHIRNLALVSGAEVVAVSDPHEGMRNASAALAGDGTAAFADHRALMDANLCDAFVIASPNDTHHDLLIDLIGTGKPILCEKPLCTTAEDCRSAIAAAEAAGTPVWVAMEYRYMPPLQRLLTEVRAGRPGKARMMSIREHRFPFLPKVGDWNRFNVRTGGTLVEKCCHFWDLMRLVLASDPVRVFASASVDENHADERYDGRRPDIIDNAYVVVDFASGARAMLDLCMFAEGARWQEIVAVTGVKGRVEARIPGPLRFAKGDHPPAEFAIGDRESGTETMEQMEIDPALLHAGDHHGSTYYQHLKFKGLVEDGGRPEVSLEDGLWSVRVGEAAERSAREGVAIVL